MADNTGTLILVASLNEKFRAMVRVVCEAFGYHVIEAQRATSATFILGMQDANETYACAFIDTTLPVGYGDAIRASGYNKPIGVLNGRVALEEELEYMLLNVDGPEQVAGFMRMVRGSIPEVRMLAA